MLRNVLIGLGVVLVALGLAYGPGGLFVTSIGQRGKLIEHMESELPGQMRRAEAAAAEAERLGNVPSSPQVAADFERAMSNVEYETRNVQTFRGIIAEEKSRRSEMIMITIAFLVGGALAIALGFVLGRKKKAVGSVVPAVA